MRLDIPGRGVFTLTHLVLDVNGTIVLDGSPPEGLSSALAGLRATLRIVAVTADTRGDAAELGRALGIEVHAASLNRRSETETVGRVLPLSTRGDRSSPKVCR